MKTVSISQMARVVENTKNRDAFEFRLKFSGVDEKYIDVLWKIYKLIHLTDYAPERVREVFKRDTTYADVADRHNVAIGTIKREVHAFSKKLRQSWGGDLWEMLMEGEDIDDDYVKELEVIVEDSLSSVNILQENLEDKFVVDLMKYVNISQQFGEISNEDFVWLRQKLVSFSKEAQKFILENTDKKLLSYGIYLLSTDDKKLNKLDRERKEELLKFTMIK